MCKTTVVLVAIMACVPALCQTQYQTIDFEQYPATPSCEDGYNPENPPYPTRESLETPWATFSGGQMHPASPIFPAFTQDYRSFGRCYGNLRTITAAFKYPVSEVSVWIYTEVEDIITIEDDHGHSMDVIGLVQNGKQPVSLPWSDIGRLTFTQSNGVKGYWCQCTVFGIDDLSFKVTATITVLDPVVDLLAGNGITTARETLAKYGTPVSAVAADRATRTVVRMRATRAGERLKLTVLNDSGQPSSSAQEDGGLGTIETGSTRGQQSVLNLTAASTSQGPMAFAVYWPPVDFSRAGRDDAAADRAVSLKVESLDYPAATATASLKVVRPPVVLVHGLWGDPSGWNSFTPLVNDSRFKVTRARYDYVLGGTISASTPTYSASILSATAANALGFDFNAPFVLADIQLALSDFRVGRNAAGVQADVIAHSMGGTVTRTLQNLPSFVDPESFTIGRVNKLITIGTPHLGSPLALQLLQTNNNCVRTRLAKKKSVSLESATVAGTVVTGAVGDLRGDGWGGAMSTALIAIQSGNGHPMPTGLIAGVSTAANLNNLDTCWDCTAWILRRWCSQDPLAVNMTAQGWPTVFGQDNDSIVPLISQLANYTQSPFTGVIHTAAIRGLGFQGPSLLEPGSNVPAEAIRLLNASSQAADFHALP